MLLFFIPREKNAVARVAWSSDIYQSHC